MKILGRLSIFPRIPALLDRLPELANNLWWSWNADAQAVFGDIDADLWERVTHNPVKLLREVRQEKLDAAAADAPYVARYQAVLARFDAYMNPAETWFSRTFPDLARQTIAYFSAEFGLHEALPIYSGGLGVLSGDHCKTASDLGLPFVAVGFLYPQGYFTQYINAEGWQEARYSKLSFSEVPAAPAIGLDGKEVLVKCELPGRDVYAKVWKIQVGRIPLYLMDTDVPQNQPGDRELERTALWRRPEPAHQPGVRAGHRRRAGCARAGAGAGRLAHERGPLGFPGAGAGAQLRAGAGVELRRSPGGGAGQYRLHHPHPRPGRPRRVQLGPDGSFLQPLLAAAWPGARAVPGAGAPRPGLGPRL